MVGNAHTESGLTADFVETAALSTSSSHPFFLISRAMMSLGSSLLPLFTSARNRSSSRALFRCLMVRSSGNRWYQSTSSCRRPFSSVICGAGKKERDSKAWKGRKVS